MCQILNQEVKSTYEYVKPKWSQCRWSTQMYERSLKTLLEMECKLGIIVKSCEFDHNRKVQWMLVLVKELNTRKVWSARSSKAIWQDHVWVKLHQFLEITGIVQDRKAQIPR